MPYYRCSECDLTVYSAARYANTRACPECGAHLHRATRVYVSDAGAADLRRHVPEPNEVDVIAAAERRTVGVGPESQSELPGSATLDPAATEFGWRWMDAVNSCDVEALIKMADRDITVSPTRLVAHDRRYLGHEGIREWIADLSTAGLAGVEHVTELRHTAPAQLVVLGQIVINDRPISPFSIAISLREGKIAETRAYLSDEAELQRIGHMPD